MKIKKKPEKYIHVNHNWKPLYDKKSKVLVLGSLPSPKSLAFGFFYGSPQNLFWPTLAKVLGKKEPLPEISSRRQFALQNHIAIWVTLKEADIVGSKDATIENPVVNDFSELMKNSDIQYIFTEGKKSTELFKTFAAEQVGIEPIYLPSASPANRAQQKKPIYLERWSLIKKAIDGLL